MMKVMVTEDDAYENGDDDDDDKLPFYGRDRRGCLGSDPLLG